MTYMLDAMWKAKEEWAIPANTENEIAAFLTGFSLGWKQARPEWVPVDERLPTQKDINEFGMIMACFPGGVVDAVGYEVGDSMGAITHWMPMTAPPDISR